MPAIDGHAPSCTVMVEPVVTIVILRDLAVPADHSGTPDDMRSTALPRSMHGKVVWIILRALTSQRVSGRGGSGLEHGVVTMMELPQQGPRGSNF